MRSFIICFMVIKHNSGNQSKENGMGGVCGKYRGQEKCIPEGQRPFGRHTRRWEDNIKIGVQEMK